MTKDHAELSHLAAATMLIGLCALACKGSKTEETTAPSASAAASVAPPVAKIAGCTVAAPFSIDKAPRADAGLTLVSLGGGRAAIGYATGAGAPKVVVIDRDGKSTQAELNVKPDFPSKLDKGVKRTVWRVTPLGEHDGKMRVGYDMVEDSPVSENMAVATRYVRCGPAHGDAFAFHDGPSFYDADSNPEADPTSDEAVELRDCRTFSDGSSTWTLTSFMTPNNEAGTYTAGWGITEKVGKEHVEEPWIDFTDLPTPKDKKPPKPVLYEVPVGLHLPGGGYIMAARYLGKVVVAKRKASLEPDGDVQKFALGGIPGMTSLTLLGDDVVLLVPTIGKVEVRGSVFAKGDVPVKPDVITIDDKSQPSEGDRTSLSGASTPDGNLLLGFVDGKGTKHKARVAVLSKDLKTTKIQPIDITSDDGNVAELRVAPLDGGRYFVAFLDLSGGKTELSGALVTCE
jgi:hypothetical protein